MTSVLSPSSWVSPKRPLRCRVRGWGQDDRTTCHFSGLCGPGGETVQTRGSAPVSPLVGPRRGGNRSNGNEPPASLRSELLLWCHRRPGSLPVRPDREGMGLRRPREPRAPRLRGPRSPPATPLPYPEPSFRRVRTLRPPSCRVKPLPFEVPASRTPRPQILPTRDTSWTGNSVPREPLQNPEHPTTKEPEKSLFSFFMNVPSTPRSPWREQSGAGYDHSGVPSLPFPDLLDGHSPSTTDSLVSSCPPTGPGVPRGCRTGFLPGSRPCRVLVLNTRTRKCKRSFPQLVWEPFLTDPWRDSVRCNPTPMDLRPTVEYPVVLLSSRTRGPVPCDDTRGHRRTPRRVLTGTPCHPTYPLLPPTATSPGVDREPASHR